MTRVPATWPRRSSKWRWPARQIWIWESVYDCVDRNAVHVEPRLPALPAPP